MGVYGGEIQMHFSIHKAQSKIQNVSISENIKNNTLNSIRAVCASKPVTV